MVLSFIQKEAAAEDRQRYQCSTYFFFNCLKMILPYNPERTKLKS